MKEEEMEKDIPPKTKSFFRKIYNNSKASLRTFRKFQDSLAKEFPGLVNKKEVKKEEKKDDKRRIQEVYERRIKYY